MRQLDIRTQRLSISPLGEGDAACLADILNTDQVAGMLAKFALPYTREMALGQIRDSKYSGDLGFLAGIRCDGKLIGGVGIGGSPVDTAFFVGVEHWGRGYATEAMAGFLDWVFAGFDLDEVQAGAFEDNPASHMVLTKLGFVRFGGAMQRSKARLEPALCFKYRLSRETFANKRAMK